MAENLGNEMHLVRIEDLRHCLIAAFERSTCCGCGWICREMNAPVLLGLCAWTGVF